MGGAPVIDPGIAIEDVDPDALARVNAALSSRDRAQRATKTIVHDGVEALGDLEALRREHDVDELVLLDRTRLDDLSAEFVDAARATDDQGDLLARCRQIYVNHPAVTLVPCPAAGGPGWGPVQRLLRSIANGRWITVLVGEWKLAAEINGGRIVRITSSPPEGAVNAVALRGSVDDLDAVLSAPNPIGELVGRVDAGLVAVDVGEGVQWVG